MFPIGDIIWQERMPGGTWLLIRVFETPKEYDGRVEFWGENDFPILRILHPDEGLIDDPSYYYTDMSGDKIVWYRRQRHPG